MLSHSKCTVYFASFFMNRNLNYKFSLIYKSKFKLDINFKSEIKINNNNNYYYNITTKFYAQNTHNIIYHTLSE